LVEDLDLQVVDLVEDLDQGLSPEEEGLVQGGLLLVDGTLAGDHQCLLQV